MQMSQLIPQSPYVMSWVQWVCTYHFLGDFQNFQKIVE